jgi:D-cysteine desulfhydrase family pyridoxal phosphate-dependent enzyme
MVLIKMILSNLPRIRLANLPTPLQELTNLTKRLEGPRIFIKRDDLTGLALGGNKTRKLEYLMGAAVKEGADYIVTGAGFQSNWCTQAAAAAHKVGMKVVLLKIGPEDGFDTEEYDGNHLLHYLIGAEIKVAKMENMQSMMDDTMEDLRSKGHKPVLLRAAGSTPMGVAGYMNAMLEIASQSVELGIKPDYLIHATGSGGTQAGLIIGSKAFSMETKIIGVTVGGRKKDEQSESVIQIINESKVNLGLDLEVTEEDVIVYDEYSGEGYGIINAEKAKAVKIAAEEEGLLIDPVYTACSMSCLIDLCKKGFFKPEDNVIFLHTGGSAALFPYKRPLKSYIEGKKPDWTIPSWSPAAG